MCIHYCSKPHHRQSLISWVCKVLWNCFVKNLLFEWATFSESLLFKEPYFLYVFARATFPEDAIFHCSIFFHSYTFYLSFSNQHTNTGVFTPKLPPGAQSGCTTQIIFLLNTMNKNFTSNLLFQHETGISIEKCEVFNKNINFSAEFQYWIS